MDRGRRILPPLVTYRPLLRPLLSGDRERPLLGVQLTGSAA